MMHRDRSPVRYLPWFARDVAIWPLSLFAGVAVGVALVIWKFKTGVGAGMAAPQAEGVQTGTWTTSLTVAVLLATAGVVGVDMHAGFYRSWFSKPMPAWWYYLQRYLLGAVVVLLAPYMFGAALAVTLGTGFGVTGHLMGTIALAYLLLGSAVFLLSIFTQRGWLLVFLITVVQGLLGTLVRGFGPRGQMSTDLWPPLVWLHRLLPPTDMVSVTQPALHGGDLAHVALYGAAMLLAALLCLRYRPLGSGGRA